MKLTARTIKHAILGLALASITAVGVSTAIPGAHADRGPLIYIHGSQDAIALSGFDFPGRATVTMDVYGSYDDPATTPNPAWDYIGTTSDTATDPSSGCFMFGGLCTSGLVAAGVHQASNPCGDRDGYPYLKVEAYYNYPDAQSGMLAYSLFPVTATGFVDCSSPSNWPPQ